MSRDQSLTELAPPHNLEAEECYIGSCLLLGRKPCHGIMPDDFHSDAHQIIYRTILGMDRVDGILLHERLRATKLGNTNALEEIGGASVIAKLFASVPHAHHADYYAGIVRDYAIRRRQRELAIGILGKIHRDSASAAETTEFIGRHADAFRDASPIRPESFDAVMQRTMDEIGRLENPEHVRCVMTGVFSLDSKLGGLMPGELVILGARPGIGKTAMAMKIAMHSARKDRRVFVASLEMESTELLVRELCRQGRVNSLAIRRAEVSRADMSSLVDASNVLAGSKMMLYAPPSASLSQIIAHAEESHATEPLSMVVVDYIGLIKKANQRQELREHIGECSKGLKQLAKSLKVPVLCLAQLNREAEGQMPTLAQLRDSGSIEQDADMVLFLHRESETEVLLIVAKARGGRVGKIKLTWRPEFTEFIDQEEPQPHALEFQ